MTVQIIREILEDFDLFLFIQHGAYADIYDHQAELISQRISKDLSVSQIEKIIWQVFYEEFCNCTVGGTDIPWTLDKDQARIILGDPDRYESLAYTIRQLTDY